MQGFQLDVPIALAVAAGLLSFLSPCVLPLVPAYIGYLGGQAVTADGQAATRRTTFLHGVFFVLGFSTIFVAMGAAASGIGQLFFSYRNWLTKIGAVVIIIFGLHTLGILKIPFMNYDTRRHYQPRPELGYASSALMGFFFGAGWSPCIGAVLGAILTLALNEGTVGRGALLLLAYSLGLGIPFLLMALGIGQVSSFFRRTQRAMRIVTIGSGVFLVVLGVLMLTNRLGWLSQWAPLIDLSL
jgi:cytochrome c-type biogenesis protein